MFFHNCFMYSLKMRTVHVINKIIEMLWPQFKCRIKLSGHTVLAIITEESPAIRFANVLFMRRYLATRAYFFRMNKPMLFQHVRFLPVQKVEAVVSCFCDQFI